MPDQTLTFIFQLTDKINKPLMDVLKNFDGTASVAEKAGKATDSFSEKMTKLGGKMFLWNQASQAIQSLNGELQKITKPGQDFQTSMADLSAITGVVGDKLDEIGGKARDTARIFGLDAAQSAESYKLILSQLNPEIAKSPEALDKMGRSIAILSKTMGGNTTAAAEVLTTAMNQYQVSLENPIAASEEMTRMMNVMSAAAKEGSAELPAIKNALEQAGMQAKMSGVSFEELNASIQVLDKAGKKGSEGGVAIRNILTILSEGRFMDKSVSKNLEHAGINIKTLGDNSKPLADRLKLLKPVMNDAALMSKMFGRENEAAALALISGVPMIEDYTNKITGTNEAQNQAGIVMDTFAEKMKRLHAWFGDLGIKIFNVTQSFLPFVSLTAGAVQIFANMGPLISGVSTAFTLLKESTVIAKIAQMEFNISALLNPYVWIPVAIAALVGLGVWLYKTSATFRAIVWGAWAFVKQYFVGMLQLVQDIGMGIWKILKGVFTLSWDDISEGFQQAAGAYVKYGKSIAEKTKEGYNEGMADFDKEKKLNTKISSRDKEMVQWSEERKAGKNPGHFDDWFKKRYPDQQQTKTDPIAKGLGVPASTADNAGKNEVRNNNIRIESLVKQLNIYASTLPEAKSKIKEEIVKLFVDMVRDTEIAIS